MGRRRQHGASGLMVVLVLVLVVIAALAARVLSRLGDAGDDKNTTIASLQRAQTALDQYVAAGGANARLPCPADPSLDTGVEVPASTKTCTFTAGTLPWATIGLRRDDAYDAWGRKLSYRVYTDNGNKGSLVQPGGPSLINCYPDTAAGGGTDTNGLCNASHTTSTFDVLKKKGGLDLTDFGTDHKSNNNDPTAYVVISHGPTGLGGYSASGVQVVTESHLGPGGDEKDNTKDSGPFHIEAWSDPDTAASSNSHFDDLLVYRTVADLAQKAGLQARGWGLASLTFDAATIAQGGGTTTTGDTGTTTLSYSTANGTITIQGFQGTNATDISYDTTGGNTGIGVYGGGSGTLMSSAGTGQSMYIKLGATARQFAITLNDFVDYSVPGFGLFPEQAQLTFYKGSNPTPLLTVQKSACSTTSTTLTTFSVVVPSDFDRVDVRPEPGSFFGFPFDSTFSISAISACRNGVICTTAIASTGTTCP